MALEAFSFVLEPVIKSLFGKLKREVQYVTKHETYLSALQKQMDQLLAKKEGVVIRVKEAKDDLKEPFKEVSEWLENVQLIEITWTTLSESMNTTSNRCFKGQCPNVLSRRRFSKQILEMIPEVEELCKSGDFTIVAHDLPLPDVVPRGASDTVNISSREVILRDVMKALQEVDIRSIGVYGMGGIGKTTLVENVNDELLVNHYFKKVIMVTVSKDPDMKLVQGRIAERLGLELKDNELATRANALYERLKKEESVLIILDDMWDTLNLDELGLRQDNGLRQGSGVMKWRLILTSRNLNVCKRMKVHKTIKIGELSIDESWALFEAKAGTGVGLSKFQNTAREIVRRCKGSPLAISVLGSRLGIEEEDEFVWEHALRVLQNPSAMGLNGIMPEVVTSLTWSYDRLSSPDVQLCFLYCCLFPEDYSIPLVDLRNYGIGEKFVKMTYTLEQASNELHCHVKILKECGLLLAGSHYMDESVKMHDVVRDVAIHIAERDEHGFLLLDVDGESRWSERQSTCKRISLTHGENGVFCDPLECPQVESLLIRETHPQLAIPDNLFEGATTLKVLDLQAKWNPEFTSFMRVPESVSCLRNVVTLYLHGCNIFKQFSILKELSRLEILSLTDSHIGELDEEFGNLTNLKFLDLSVSPIYYVAPNVFSKLTRIEELYMPFVRCKWGRANEGDIRTNASFREVATLPRLCLLKTHVSTAEESHPDWFKNVKQFDISIDGNFREGIHHNNSARIRMQNMEKRHWVSNLLANSKRNINLILRECSGFKSITDLGVDGGLNRIEYLKLSSCADLEKVIAANESNTVKVLYLEELERLEGLLHGVTSSGKLLEQLQQLVINECPKLSIIFPYNLLVPGEGLGNLRYVTVSGCDAVEHVFSTEDDEMAIESSGASLAIKSLLVGITEISLSELPKLKSIWKGVVPAGSLHNLTRLDVRDCSLKHLMSSDMAVSILKIEKITVKRCYAIEELIHSQEQENIKTPFIPYPPLSPTFQSLHTLKIASCPNLKFLFSLAVANHFNQLHSLSIDDCSGLLCVFGSAEEEPGVNEHNGLLPALRDLTVRNVWRLTSFFKGDLLITSPLEHIDLKWCPILKRFPLQNVSSIKTFSRQDTWYRRLDEEDRSRLSIFQPSLKQDGDIDSDTDRDGDTDISRLPVFQPSHKQDDDILYSAVAGLWSDHNASHLEGITQIQQFLVKSKPEYLSSEEVTQLLKLVVEGVVPRSIEFLKRDDFPELQSKTAWMLANWASRPMYIQVDDLVPILVNLCSSPHENIREMVALALGVMKFVRTSELTTGEVDDWVVPMLVKLLYSHDEDIGAMAASILSTTAATSADGRDVVLRHGGLTALLTQLNGNSESQKLLHLQFPESLKLSHACLLSR